MQPVIKNKEKSQHETSNYRPVTRSVSIILTVCNNLSHVFSFIEPRLTSHVNQFDFVKGGGCNKTLFAFSNTMNYFVEKQRNDYFCGL